MSEIYRRLQKHFDTMASGFPESKDGIELKILQMLYNEKEAALFLDMSPKKETPGEASLRLGCDENELAEELEAMAKKGLLYRERENGKVLYCASPFVVGILEFNVHKVAESKEFAQMVAAYGVHGFMKSLSASGEQHMRTIPINTNLVDKWPIATCDDAVKIINSHEKIAVIPCTCRTIFNSIGMKSCENPINNCIGFGKMAEYFLENNIGREISKEEAISIVEKSDEMGMVLQPFNGEDQGAICSCCSDCCSMLMSLKMRPDPASDVKSSYFAEIDGELCTGCQVCINRCQIDAIKMNDDYTAEIDLKRCIGCGLCVTTCPTDAVSLVKKPESELQDIPQDLDDAHRIMAENRGFALK